MIFRSVIFTFALIVGILAPTSVKARDLIEMEVIGLSETRRAFSTIELASSIGIQAGQRFSFELGRSGIYFLVEGDISFVKYSVPSGMSMSGTSAVGYGGRGGFKWGGNRLYLTTVAGIRNNNILYEPTTTSLAFAGVLAPEVAARFYWAPLAGRNHIIGLMLTGSYLLSGSDSTSGTAISSGYSYGGAMYFDFTPAGLPMALFGGVTQTQYTATGGSQSRMSLNLGLRFGASLSNPRKSE